MALPKQSEKEGPFAISFSTQPRRFFSIVRLGRISPLIPQQKPSYTPQATLPSLESNEKLSLDSNSRRWPNNQQGEIYIYI